VARFYRMLGDMSEVGFVAEGSLVRVTLQPAVHLDANRLRHYTEHSLAVMVSRGRMLAERDIPLRAVRFAHDAPARTSEHERVFRAPVAFRQPQNELVIDRAALEVPLRSTSDALFVALERAGGDPRLSPAVDDDVARRLRVVLSEAMRVGDSRIG